MNLNESDIVLITSDHINSYKKKIFVKNIVVQDQKIKENCALLM